MEKTKDNQFYGRLKSCKWTEWTSNDDDGFDINTGIIRYDECGCIIYEEENGEAQGDKYEYNSKGLLINHITRYEHTKYVYRGDGKLLEVLRYGSDDNLKLRKIYGEYGIEREIEYTKDGVDNETTFSYKNGLLIKEVNKNYIINYEYDEYGRLIEERNVENWEGYKLRYTKKYKYDYRNLIVESIKKDGYTCERIEYIYDGFGRIVEEYGFRIPYLQDQEVGEYHIIKEFDKYGNCVSEIHNSFDDKRQYRKLLQEFEYYDQTVSPDDLPKKINVCETSEEGLLRKLASKNCSWFHVCEESIDEPVKEVSNLDHDLLKIITDGYPTIPFESLTEADIEQRTFFADFSPTIKDGVYKLVHVICKYTTRNRLGELVNCSCVPLIDDENFHLVPLSLFIARKYPFVMNNNSNTKDHYSIFSPNYPIPFVEGEESNDTIKRVIRTLSSVRTIQIHHSPQMGHWDNPYIIRKHDFILRWAEVIDNKNDDFWELKSDVSALEYRIGEAINKCN